MENYHYDGTAQDNTGRHQDWQNAERNESQWQAGADDSDHFDMRSAEANGYGAKFAVGSNEEEDEEDAAGAEETVEGEDDANEESDHEIHKNDWGQVDPQEDGLPSENDPSAPGSAV
jgi:hypothetical protein